MNWEVILSIEIFNSSCGNEIGFGKPPANEIISGFWTTFKISLINGDGGANILFDDALTEIYVKLFGIYTGYKETGYAIIRKQVLETRKIADNLLAELRKSEAGLVEGA